LRYSQEIENDATNWIPEGGVHPSLFLFFIPNPNSPSKYCKISRLIGSGESTLCHELRLIFEKRQEVANSFEIYSKLGEVLDPSSKLRSIEGRCVFLVYVGGMINFIPLRSFLTVRC
jgi:hypothetical protein